jgi:hypothetical protein
LPAACFQLPAIWSQFIALLHFSVERWTLDALAKQNPASARKRPPPQ